ncbi:M23 family metallopeptidase [Corynebacterium epidermidicanis]|uniref:Peptidase family M23 n=1 Tax=Corynebacterium epidermidicanis TaxID=1050174 RepID=A0A0G3GX36_9CORY|nr:M23 family metallopeptidase [Corynebacterium epidermidicanis]AKK03417.1 Peptidase family M23 [Corynebacterium epidermidicanis]
MSFRIFIALLVAFMSFSLNPSAWAYVDPVRATPYASRVTDAFDKPAKNWHRGHRGVNLAAEPGSAIHAAETGKVAFVGVIAGVPVISIDHPDGIRTTYQPVHAYVSQGDDVREGQIIGTLGHPTATDVGLHWGALVSKDDYINPLSLLDSPVIRLKPVDEPD